MSLGRRDNFNLSFPGDLQGTSRRGGANFKLRPPCCIRTGKPEPVLSFGGIKSGRTIFFVAGDKNTLRPPLTCGRPLSRLGRAQASLALLSLLHRFGIASTLVLLSLNRSFICPSRRYLLVMPLGVMRWIILPASRRTSNGF